MPFTSLRALARSVHLAESIFRCVLVLWRQKLHRGDKPPKTEYRNESQEEQKVEDKNKGEPVVAKEQEQQTFQEPNEHKKPPTPSQRKSSREQNQHDESVQGIPRSNFYNDAVCLQAWRKKRRT